MNEIEIQADYSHKIAQAEQSARDLLNKRIAQLKAERNQALAALKKEAENEAQKEAPPQEQQGSLHKAEKRPRS